MMDLRDQNGSFTNTTQQSSTSSTTRPFKPLAKEFFYIALGMQWLNVVLIITLNIAVIVTVLRRPKKSRLYFLLMNMAIADLMTRLTDALANAMERTAGIQYIDYMWLAADTLCKIQRWISNTCCVASNYILAATSVDRALVVVKPLLNFKRGYVLQKSLIGACWLLSLAVNSSLFFFFEFKTKKSPFFNDTNLTQCDLIADVFDHYKVAVNILFLFYVGLPLMVIIVSCTVLIYAIYKRARSPPHRMRGMNPLKFPMIFNRGIPSSKARSIKLTFGITLSFVLSWTPFIVVISYGGAYSFNEGPIRMLFVTAYYWNSVANPIVFFVFHKQHSVSSPCSNSYMVTNKYLISLDNRKTPERILKDAEAVPMCIS